MADSRRDTQFSAQERGAELRDEFLARISLAAMATGEVAVETRDMPRPVTQLVQLGAGDVFGAAALGTLINIGVATTEDPQLTYGGIGGVTRDPVDAAIADGVQRSASTVTSRVVDRGLAIPPTIRVEAGKRISVVVTRRAEL
jgi:hypothetical protein